MKEFVMRIKALNIIIFLLLISIPVSNCYPQQLHKIYDVPGSGTTPASNSSENSNTALYVLGGALVAGIVIYALLRDKKEKPSQDTTAAILNDDFLAMNMSFSEKVTNLQSQVPIKISIGLQSNRVIREEKRYFVGLNYNF